MGSNHVRILWEIPIAIDGTGYPGQLFMMKRHGKSNVPMTGHVNIFPVGLRRIEQQSHGLAVQMQLILALRHQKSPARPLALPDSHYNSYVYPIYS